MFDYVMGIIEVIAIAVGLMSGILSILREWYLLTYPDRAPTKNVFWASVRIAFIVSAVLAWFGEHHKFVELTQKVNELSRPDFHISILGVQTGTSDKRIPHINLLLRISNLGSPSAAVADTWAFHVITKDSIDHVGLPQNINPDTGAAFCQPGTGMGVKYTREDSLDWKASHVIDRNGYEQGLLMFDFPDVSSLGQLEDATTFKISVEDVNGDKFGTEEGMDSIKNKTQRQFVVGVRTLAPRILEECKGK